MRILTAVVAALLLTAAACKREPERARVDAALAPLVPRDAVALACLRLDRLRNTPFYRQYIDGKKLPQLEKFAEETGLDLRKDVWELVLVLREKGRDPLVLIRGKFGGEFGKEPRFEKPGIQRMNYKGYYIVYAEGPGVLFMNTGAAVAGKIEDLKELVDGRDAPDWRARQELLDIVGTLPGKAQVWMVAEDGGALLPEVALNGDAGNIARMVRSLGRLTMAADLRSGLDLTIEGVYADEQAAKQMQATLRALLAVGRLKTPDDQPDMLRFYDGFSIEARETLLTLRVHQPFELMEKIIALLPESRRPG